MAEQQKSKEVKVIIDRSEEIKSKDAEIDLLNRKLGEHEALIKRYMAEDAKREQLNLEAERQKAIWSLEGRKPPEGGDTARLDTEDNTKKRFKFPYDQNSEVLDILSFASNEDAVKFLKDCASNPQSADFKLANVMMGKAIKRVLKEGGSWEFQGNMCRYERRGDKVVRAERKPVFKRVGDD